MSSLADVVAGHLASLPPMARGPALRAVLATARNQLAVDEPRPEQLAAAADRLLRGLHVDGIARLEANRALIPALEAEVARVRKGEVEAVREHLEAEAERLHRQAAERMSAAAARIWTRWITEKPTEDREALRSDIRICLVVDEPSPPPEVDAWHLIYVQLWDRHGADIVADAAVPFHMPDIREIVDQSTKEV